MSKFTEHYFQSHDGLKLYYRDYTSNSGEALVDQPIPILCLHGLTRNSRDFEDLAPVLAKTHRVLVADVRGRGLSDYDAQWHNYNPATYVEDCWTLLDNAGVDRCTIVGTSMGGLIAMAMAVARPDRIASIVLNDVGPEIDPRGLARIQNYLGDIPAVDNWRQPMARVKQLNETALPGLNDEQWLRITKRLYRERESGHIVIDHDANIARPFAEAAGQTPPDLWGLYGAIQCPILALRGEHSDILSAEVLEQMVSSNEHTVATTVANRGHAPLLDENDALISLLKFINDSAKQVVHKT